MKVIRKATLADLEQIAALEAACFPAQEAASEKVLKRRLQIYADCFLVMDVDGKIISMVNGMVTDRADLLDEMYSDERLHQPDGCWQMIFGVDTDPAFQRQGLAEETLQAFIEKARAEGRKGLVLTCKDRLLHYYAKFGFVNEGLSESEHGDAEWYQMRLVF